MARIVASFGLPPMWAREQGFGTLVHIILEQQVSLASARAAFERLLAIASPLTPESFSRLGDDALRAAGFSRQKTAYCRHLAASILRGELDVAALASSDDETVRIELMQVKGVGRWTADIYLLMALRRPDVWPSGDLALSVAIQRINRLEYRPTPEELETYGARWRPWRAVAARVLWHYYLSEVRAARA